MGASAERYRGAVLLSVWPEGNPAPIEKHVLSPNEAQRLAAQLLAASWEPGRMRGIEQAVDTVREGKAVIDDARSVFQAATQAAQRAARVLSKIEGRRGRR